MNRVSEIGDPQGGRNRIRAGDAVRVLRGGVDASGFDARFRYADVDDAGEVVAVTVFGGRGFRPELPTRSQHGIAQFRTLRPERIRRRSQTVFARKVRADA